MSVQKGEASGGKRFIEFVASSMLLAQFGGQGCRTEAVEACNILLLLDQSGTGCDKQAGGDLPCRGGGRIGPSNDINLGGLWEASSLLTVQLSLYQDFALLRVFFS